LFLFCFSFDHFVLLFYLYLIPGGITWHIDVVCECREKAG